MPVQRDKKLKRRNGNRKKKRPNVLTMWKQAKREKRQSCMSRKGKSIERKRVRPMATEPQQQKIRGALRLGSLK